MISFIKQLISNCAASQVIALCLMIALSACTQSNFGGKLGQKEEVKVADNNIEPEKVPPKPVQKIKKNQEAMVSSQILKKVKEGSIQEASKDLVFKGGSDSKGLSPNQKQFIWLATRSFDNDGNKLAEGIARRLEMNGNQVISDKQWKVGSPGAGGTRTYVIEGGSVILSKQGGELYFIHGEVNTATNLSDPNNGYYYKIPNVGIQERACVVSYKRNKQRFIGVGYGFGMYVEFKQSNSPPYAPDFKNPGTPIKLHDKRWGYSCYIDQNKLIYYGQWLNSQFQVQAVDLNIKEGEQIRAISAEEVAPNGDFKSDNLPLVGVVSADDLGKGNYALAGDRTGNILNGTEYYTMSHEAVSNTIWATQGSLLHIYPQTCFFKDKKCEGYATYPMTSAAAAVGEEATNENAINGIGAPLGPLSALGDGGMVGLIRNNVSSDVFILRLNDPKDPAGGISATKIAELSLNDPYMYTDFTGATLYLENSLNEFDFSKSETWTENRTVKQISLIWETNKPDDVNWANINAEIRCYSDSNAKGNFRKVEIKVKPMQQQFVAVDSCNNKNIHLAELKLSQIDSGSDLLNISKIKITAFQ